MKKPTKAHIICSLITTHGPMTRAELLEATAKIEGKPYRPASNNSYFVPYADGRSPSKAKHSLVANGTIQAVGKRGNALVYMNTLKGFTRAAEYLSWRSTQA